MAKERLDKLLVDLAFFDSRERARRAIMAGMVLVDDEPAIKPGTRVETGSSIRVKKDPVAYVSRGGLKLEKGIKEFNIELEDLICLDIGASTGGFTDCMLKNGAKKFMLLMWGTASWPGSVEMIPGLFVWKGQTSVI